MAVGRLVRVALLVSLAAVGAERSLAQAPGVDAAEKKLLGAEGLLGRAQYDLSRQEFEDFLTQYAGDARAMRAKYGLGVCAYNLNDLAGAERNLVAVVGDKRFAKRDEAMSLLGTVQLQRGELQQAVATFQGLGNEYPKSAQVESADVNLAQALYRLRRYGESLDAVRQLLKAFPKTGYRASALYVGALDQRGLGDDAEAGRTLAEVVRAYPNSPFVYDARLLMGQILTAQGKFDEAIGEYQKLLGEAPESEKPAIEYGLGTAFMQAGRYGEAEGAFETIGSNYKTSEYAGPAALQRGVAQVKSGRREEARGTLAAVGQSFPGLGQSVAYWMARCDLLDGKFDVAARGLERLVGTHVPEVQEAEFDLAYCELRLGHDAAALQRLEAFRQKYAQSTHTGEALYYEASGLFHTGEFAKSVEFCEAAEKSASAGVARQATLLKGEGLLMMGQYAKADAVFAPLEKSPASEEERVRLELRRGQCAYFGGDYKTAEERLAEVAKSPSVKEDPSLDDAVFFLGDAQLQRGENDAAVGTLALYLKGARPGERRQEATYKLATAQERTNDSAAAGETLHALMREDIKSPWVQRAWYEVGQISYQNHDAVEGRRALTTVLAANPGETIAAPALYLLARMEMGQGQNAEAAKHLEQLLHAYPHQTLAEEAAFVRGSALKDAKEFEPAAAQFAEYVQSYPNGKFVTEARRQRAVCLTGMNRADEAIRVLSDLAKGATRNDGVLYDLAWAYRGANDLPHAEETYQSLVKEYPAGPQSTAARVELAQLLYGQKKYAEAMEQLIPAAADSRADAHLHAVTMYWTGCCQARLGESEKAAATFEAFVAANPHDPLVAQALSEAGEAYAQLGTFAEAEARQKRVMTEFPNTDTATLAMLRLGETQNQATDYPAAAATFGEWLKAHADSPLTPRAEFGIGWSLENRGQDAEAREHYAKVIARDNGVTGARAQFQIGETYFAQKQYDAAARELLKVDILYSAPEWAARALYEAGRAFEQLHQADQARRQFEECVKKYKDSDVAPLARKRLDALAGAK